MKQLIQTIQKNYSAEQIKEFNEVLEQLNFLQEASHDKKTFEKQKQRGVITAQILCHVKIDLDSLMAAFLLDLFRGGLVSESNLNIKTEVIGLLKDTIKLDSIIYGINEQNTTNLRSMFVAMSKDIRTLIIKLADVLNLALNPVDLTRSDLSKLHDKIKVLYAPLAARLGLNYIRARLQDENFKFLQPEEYSSLKRKVTKDELERTVALNKALKEIKNILIDMDLEGEVYGRLKQVSSIHRKLEVVSDLEKIHDLAALRVILNSTNECYGVLGAIHALFVPADGKFRDYIAKPKPNGYRSLHTSVYITQNQMVEIQIRTREMHDFAEYGVAAHWLYKEKSGRQNALDKKLTWIRQIIESDQLLSSSDILKELIEEDDYIYVQTPKGNIISLPSGATPVDFAYHIHSEVGNKCTGAKVNGKMVPLNTVLGSGEVVEIITQASARGPSKDWLKFIKSAVAKDKINNYFKKEKKEENIKKGKTIIEQAAKARSLQLHKLLEEKACSDLFERYSLQNLEDMYASVGYGTLTANQVLNKLLRFYQENSKEDKDNIKDIAFKPALLKNATPNTVFIRGLQGVFTKFAKCCTPIPQDDIVAYISRGRGATIHRSNCPAIRLSEPERLILAEWGDVQEAKYPANLKILAKNTSGILALISNKIADLKINISSVKAQPISTDKSIIYLTVMVQKKEELLGIINKLNQLSSIYEVHRENED